MEIRPVYQRFGVGAADVWGEFQQPAVPLSLGTALGRSTMAMTAFGALDTDTKARIIDYVNAASTPEESTRRIRRVVTLAREQQLSLLDL